MRVWGCSEGKGVRLLHEREQPRVRHAVGGEGAEVARPHGTEVAAVPARLHAARSSSWEQAEPSSRGHGQRPSC